MHVCVCICVSMVKYMYIYIGGCFCLKVRLNLDGVECLLDDVTHYDEKQNNKVSH